MTDEPQSLKACFADAEVKRKSLDTIYDSGSDTYQENLASAIVKYQECIRIAAEVSLFSSNETLEDVSSSDLQYLLPHFHTATLLFRVRAGDRKTLILQARTELERYLKLLDTYDILTKQEAKLYEAYKESPNTFSTASQTDASARRQQKISRFREEKAVKEKLESLRKNPSILANDDAVLRDLHLTNITLCTFQAFADLESIAQELDILSLAPPPGTTPLALENGNGDARTRNGATDTYSDRVDTDIRALLSSGRNGGPILSKSGRPLRPFTLTDQRQRLQQGVFRPDHNLPTMSIDEYLEEEKKRGGMIEGGGEASGQRPEPNEDDYRATDAATMKARHWDDFKEDNPKGGGNTMNMG